MSFFEIFDPGQRFQRQQRDLEKSLVLTDAQGGNGPQPLDQRLARQPIPPEAALHGAQTGRKRRLVEHPPARHPGAHRSQLPTVAGALPRPAAPGRLPTFRVGAPHQTGQGRTQVQRRHHVAGLKLLRKSCFSWRAHCTASGAQPWSKRTHTRPPARSGINPSTTRSNTNTGDGVR